MLQRGHDKNARGGNSVTVCGAASGHSMPSQILSAHILYNDVIKSFTNTHTHTNHTHVQGNLWEHTPPHERALTYTHTFRSSPDELITIAASVFVCMGC